MIDEQDLDRLIDNAAGRLIEREPSRALSRAVMARTRQSDTPPPRRFMWATATVAAACILIALVMIQRSPLPVAISTSGPEQPPVAVISPPVVDLPERVPADQSAEPVARSASRTSRPSRLPPTDLLPNIEPITAEPLVVPLIDLPVLHTEAAVVEEIEIQALTIEPLTASND